MVSVFNLLTSTVHSLALTKKHARPLWPGSQFTDIDCSLATYRGLRFIYRTTLRRKHFVRYGADYVWCFYTISASVKDPKLRRMARRMGVELARRWRRNHRRLPQNASSEKIMSFTFGNDAA